MNCHRQVALMTVLGWFALMGASPSLAQSADGQALMRSGNDLFRAGDYAAARDRYQEAMASGYEAPLLHYNLGIANYRLGEFLAAELALERAAEDPSLAPLAFYNLGLATLAAGWPDAAASRFEQVLAVSSDTALRTLASVALERTQSTENLASRRRDPATSEWRPYREPDPPIGQLNLIVAARYGTDDNVYRAPPGAYADLNQAGQPTINPVQQSASFMPVDLLAQYVIDSGERTQFNLSYRLNGDFYESLYANANETTQRIAVGADVVLEGRHERSLETSFFAAIHEETNFDPDTGLDRDFAGQDVSDRFSYAGAGLTSTYEHLLNDWYWGFDARIERRSYSDSPLLTPYDHEFYYFNLWTERLVSANTLVTFGAGTYRREYDLRRARDLNGILATTNPALEYVYSSADIGVEHQLTDNLLLGISFQRVERTDNFESYADYSQDSLRLGASYWLGRRARIDLIAISRTYDYPNAFAFNQPAGGPMDIDSTDAEIAFEYRFSSTLSVLAQFELRDESSSDPRISYARNRAILGIKWRR